MKTPYISPLYGDFTDFPPVLIHVGSDEVLLDDSRELAIRMEAQGVTVDIDIYDGMWHVWHMFDVEEAPGGRSGKSNGSSTPSWRWAG